MSIGDRVQWLYKDGIVKSINNNMVSVEFIIDGEDYISNIHKSELTILN